MPDEPRTTHPVLVQIVSPVAFASKPRTLPEHLSTWVPLFISALALGISIWSSYQTRVHNRLSVKPHLSFVANLGAGKDDVGLFIVNNGSGTAILRRLELVVDVNRFSPREYYQEYHKMFKDGYKVLVMGARVTRMPAQALRAGEQRYVFKTMPDNAVDLDEAHRLLARTEIEWEYCSIYDECVIAEED